MPIILAIRADYTDNTLRRINILEEAWRIAVRSWATKHRVSIASSRAETFIDELQNGKMGGKWLNALEASLDVHWDDNEHLEFKRLSEAIKKLEIER